MLRPVVLFDAIKGYNRAKNDRSQFVYNLLRLTTTSLVNTQLKYDDRLKPSQLWPDWNTTDEIETPEGKVPDMVEVASRAIQILNTLE